MLRFSIRKLMRAIALLAVALGIYVTLARWYDVEAHRMQCQSNMRNVVLAILGYENSQGIFPAGTFPNPSLAPKDRLSWYADISPYIDEKRPYYPIDRTQPWNVGINLSFACQQYAVFKCPDRSVTPPGPAQATYIGIAGLGSDAPLLPKGDPRAGLFGYDRQTTIADIKDGLGMTMLVAESGRVSGSWLAGGPATVRGLDPDEQPYLGPGRQFGGRHHGGAMIGMADGSVRFVRESVDPKLFESLSTIAGGDNIPFQCYE